MVASAGRPSLVWWNSTVDQNFTKNRLRYAIYTISKIKIYLFLIHNFQLKKKDAKSKGYIVSDYQMSSWEQAINEAKILSAFKDYERNEVFDEFLATSLVFLFC